MFVDLKKEDRDRTITRKRRKNLRADVGVGEVDNERKRELVEENKGSETDTE